MNFNNEKSRIQGIQSVEHAFFILDTIKESSVPLTLSEISCSTNMSKSRVQKYTVSLLRSGVLTQNKKNNTYSFGPKLLEFGLSSLQRLDIIELSDYYLEEIRNELHQTSALNIWTETGPVVVKSKTSEEPVNVNIKIGYCPPIYESATGKCFVAFMDSYKIEEFIDSEVQQYNLSRNRLEKELEEIKNNGYAYRDTKREGIPGGVAITCPVFNNSSKIVAVISVIGFSGSIDTRINSKEVKKLKEITSKLSHELF